jgi:Zn-dependent M28 family amino/carboxypeptidase
LVEFQEYLLMERLVKNIIAQKPGNKKSAEIIVVGAHYDTCFNPGADDNASGVAGLLELARLIASERYPLFLGPFYLNRANFIAVVGNFSNRRLVRRLAHYFREYSQFPK